MKRDTDLIRDMLFEAEEDASHLYIAALSMGAGEEDKKKYYHAELLCDAGFFDSKSSGVYRLTSQGHDYLDAVRDEGIWKQTKKAVADTGGSATLEIVKSVAVALLKERIGKITGLDI